MAKQKRPPGSGPLKQNRRGDVTIDFNPIDSHFPSGNYYYDKENRYQALYPSVYSIKLQGHGYFPFWDFFADQYFEDLELLNSEQMWLYTYLASLRNRGIRLSINGSKSKDSERRGLAAMLGRWRPAVIKDLDHLEDCMLIHRVRRLDLHGTPNDIIVHTPFTPPELHDSGWHKVIKDRIANETTRRARERHMVTGVDDEGNKFAYLNRTGGDGRFHYDARQVDEAFGQNAKRFCDFALTFFRKHFWVLFEDKPAFDEDYRRELRLELNLYGVNQNSDRERCYVVANKFRTIYCPSLQELISV
jgi:hypothetical protein